MCKMNNKRGIALVTSLMLTLISLTIVMALLYMITQGTTVSASLKRYKTALEATHGGSQLFTKDILPFILQNYENSNLQTEMDSSFGAVTLNLETSLACLQAKITTHSSTWPEGCSNTSDPKKSPDLTFKLSATTGAPYTIYSKIIESFVGNTDVSGLQLEGAGVSEAQSGITPQHFPYLYRLELQGERENNPAAQANIEVLYAY